MDQNNSSSSSSSSTLMIWLLLVLFTVICCCMICSFNNFYLTDILNNTTSMTFFVLAISLTIITLTFGTCAIMSSSNSQNTVGNEMGTESLALSNQYPSAQSNQYVNKMTQGYNKYVPQMNSYFNKMTRKY